MSAPCLLFVFSLSVRYLLFIRSLSAFVWVYGLALAEPLSALCPLSSLCAFVCSVSAFVRLSRGFCIGLGYAFACCSSGYIWPAVLLSALGRCRAFAPCRLFFPFVRVFCIFCLVFFRSSGVRIFILRLATWCLCIALGRA